MEEFQNTKIAKQIIQKAILDYQKEYKKTNHADKKTNSP